MANLAYIQYIPKAEGEAFAKKVIKIAKNLRTDPNWLMQVMFAESKLKPDARNTFYPFMKNGKLDGYATGLIQFVPDTARYLGTTTWELEKMSRVEQLDWVEKYFVKAGMVGRLNSYFDVYLVVFFPAAIGQKDNYVFETRYIHRASVAKANPAININKDAMITMAEFKQYLLNTIPKELKSNTYGVIKFIEENPGKTGIGGVVLGLIAFTIYKATT